MSYFKGCFFYYAFGYANTCTNSRPYHTVCCIPRPAHLRSYFSNPLQALDVDPYEVQIKLALGQSPEPPQIKDAENSAGLVGTNAYLNVFVGEGDGGISAEDVVDFEALEKVEK